MRQPCLAIGLAFLFCATASAQSVPSIVESWAKPSHTGGYSNIIVVGISADQELRHRFEDRFVSHLRGHQVKGVTSHSLVKDLERIEDRTAILNEIMAERIDGVISVRLVPLEKAAAGAWADGWAAGMEADSNLRLLIEETLPVKPSKAKRFAVEIAFWDTEHLYRVWAGRTGDHKMKQLQENAGDLVQYAIGALKSAGLIQ